VRKWHNLHTLEITVFFAVHLMTSQPDFSYYTPVSSSLPIPIYRRMLQFASADCFRGFFCAGQEIYAENALPDLQSAARRVILWEAGSLKIRKMVDGKF